jgi:hypothetical protein
MREKESNTFIFYVTKCRIAVVVKSLHWNLELKSGFVAAHAISTCRYAT